MAEMMVVTMMMVTTRMAVSSTVSSLQGELKVEKTHPFFPPFSRFTVTTCREMCIFILPILEAGPEASAVSQQFPKRSRMKHLTNSLFRLQYW